MYSELFHSDNYKSKEHSSHHENTKKQHLFESLISKVEEQQTMSLMVFRVHYTVKIGKMLTDYVLIIQSWIEYCVHRQ